jgi:hypothetical protein
MINYIAGVLIAVAIANLFISAQANAPLAPDVHVFPPPLSVGKQRSFSSTRDASMHTQQVRRQAVINGHHGSPGYILHETPHTSGFTNGVLELSLSGVCQRVCAAVCNPILDAGTSSSEFCALDGNGNTVLDAGTSQTVVC